MGRRSELVSTYEWHLAASNIPAPVKEYVFHPGRKWAFDYAWPELHVAVELEGGIYKHGKPVFNVNPKTGKVYSTTAKSGHLTVSGYESDIEKYNQAVLDGWHLLRFTTRFVKSGNAIDMTVKLINCRISDLSPVDNI